MAKGKNKAFKMKEYKVPPEKYVVVVNPWGLPDKIDMNTKLNEIGAWFELLLRRDYPNARVREIFYQKTHRNIIVELPQEIDINKYLGAYHYSRFHNNISPNDPRTAYIYEYRYTHFGNPGKKDWSGIIPTNHNIPAGLLRVLKDPFPVPSPAPLPPSDTPYARPIPPNIQSVLAAIRDVPLIGTSLDNKGKGKSIEVSPLPPPSPTPDPTPNVGSSCSFDLPSTKSLFTPYEPPSHYVAHIASRSRIDQQEQATHELPQVKKMDPYEEEEVAKVLLQSSPVKKDELNEAVDFLKSFLSNIKSEEKPIAFPSASQEDSKSTSHAASTSDGDGDYKPSADLLDLFNTLPAELSSSTGEGSSTARKDVVVKSEVLDTVLRYDGDSSSDPKDIIVKSEVVETKLTHDEEYRPSGELLSAFASLPNIIGCDEQSIKREPQGSATGLSDLRVKEEPTEIQLPGRISSLSERKQLPRSSTSRTTMETPRQLAPDNARYNSNVQIKPEPVDDPKMSFSSNHHYPIPRDPRRSLLPPENGNSDSHSSRDPRKRRMPAADLPIKHERNLEGHNTEDEDSVLFRKRLKMER